MPHTRKTTKLQVLLPLYCLQSQFHCYLQCSPNSSPEAPPQTTAHEIMKSPRQTLVRTLAERLVGTCFFDQFGDLGL
ncbi:hypothetical protein L6164_007963 [Bauhinia variegata]|uniref:Uncharacterized protein n=1 Tax=Bauhinia variegata TaxID=167791 RepID=A0ACB9PKP1_BAUVA|nr:hypothetical protein L6164_007963 [Bauhinia variegata]